MSKNAPSLSQVIRPTMREYNGRKLPAILVRLLGHVFLALFVVIGIALLFIQPLSVLTCHHVEPRHTDCRLQRRIAWVIPVKEIPITGLEEAWVSEERATRTDEDGEPVEYTLYSVNLVSEAGEISLADADDEWSFSSHLTAARINAYLNAPTEKRLTIWGYGLWIHTLVTLCCGVFLLIFSFVFVTFVLNSLLLFGAWSIDCVLAAVGWVLDCTGLFSAARSQIPRLCQAVREISIQPNSDESVQTDKQGRN